METCLALSVYELRPGHEKVWLLTGNDTKGRPVEECSFHGLSRHDSPGSGMCEHVQHLNSHGISPSMSVQDIAFAVAINEDEVWVD